MVRRMTQMTSMVRYHNAHSRCFLKKLCTVSSGHATSLASYLLRCLVALTYISKRSKIQILQTSKRLARSTRRSALRASALLVSKTVLLGLASSSKSTLLTMSCSSCMYTQQTTLRRKGAPFGHFPSGCLNQCTSMKRTSFTNPLWARSPVLELFYLGFPYLNPPAHIKRKPK